MDANVTIKTFFEFIKKGERYYLMVFNGEEYKRVASCSSKPYCQDDFLVLPSKYIQDKISYDIFYLDNKIGEIEKICQTEEFEIFESKIIFFEITSWCVWYPNMPGNFKEPTSERVYMRQCNYVHALPLGDRLGKPQTHIFIDDRRLAHIHNNTVEFSIIKHYSHDGDCISWIDEDDKEFSF